MSIFSKLLGRSGGSGDPDKPLVAGAIPNAAEDVGGAQTETIGGARTETVGATPLEMPAWHESVLTGDVAAAKSEAGEEVLLAFEHGDRADPNGGGGATGDPFAVKIEHVVPSGGSGAAEQTLNQSFNYRKLEWPDGEAAGDDVVVDGQIIAREDPVPLDDGSIPTETLSLNFDKITVHEAPGGPGANELSMDDTAGAEPASDGPVATYNIQNAWPSKLDDDPDGGGPAGELAKKAAGEQEYLEVKLENVQITSYQLGVLDSNSEDPGGGPGSVAAEPRAGVMMKESGEKGGTEDINIGVGELQESPAFDPAFRGGVSVAAGDVSEAPGTPSLSEIVVTKSTDSTSPLLMEEDDDGSTLESLSVQETGAIGGAIGGFANDGDDEVPDLDDLDLDDDSDLDL